MTFIPDPELLEVMDRRVAVLLDSNIRGTAKTDRGYVPEGPWLPVDGLESVPTHMVAKNKIETSLDGRVTVLTYYRWLFVSPIALDRGHRLEWIDPLRNVPQHFDVINPSEDPGGPDGGNGVDSLYWAVNTEIRNTPPAFP